MEALYRAARGAFEDDVLAERIDDVVRGSSAGVPIEIRFVTRDEGDEAQPWTEIEAAADPMGLVLALRPQTPDDRALVRQGLAVDLATGDAAFDRAFTVEAAPSDVALALLNAEIRAGLLALGRVEVVTVGAAVRLEQRGWEGDRRRLRTMVATVGKVAAGVAEAWQRVQPGAVGYRGPARGEGERRLLEVEALGAMRGARETALQRRNARTGLLALAAIVLGVVAASLFILCDQRAGLTRPPG